jgi:hypothetical protein
MESNYYSINKSFSFVNILSIFLDLPITVAARSKA